MCECLYPESNSRLFEHMNDSTRLCMWCPKVSALMHMLAHMSLLPEEMEWSHEA